MDKKYKQKWLKELRSGKWKQTRGQMVGKFGRCCLGVLCETVPDVSYRSVGFKNGYYTSSDIRLSDSSELTSAGLYYFGLTCAEQQRLVRLNDNSKKNFRQIAEIIEKEL